MHYSTGYSFNTRELFLKFPLNKLKIENKDLDGKRRDDLLVPIFLYAVKIILEDVFKNGFRFVLPTGKRKCYIEMKLLSNDRFRKARINGKFKKIDYYMTDFSAYDPVYVYQSVGVRKEKPIHVSKNLQSLIINNTNNGFNFFNTEKTVKDYIPEIMEKFYYIPKKDIYRIVVYGWRMFCLANLYGCDTLLKDDVNLKYLFYVGELTFDSLKHHLYSLRKQRNKLRLLDMYNGRPFHDAYYVGLTKDKMKDFILQFKPKGSGQRGPKKKIYNLKEVYLYKLLDECKCYHYDYIFKINTTVNIGYKKYKEKYETRNIELVYRRDGNGYESANNSQQYIDELFERDFNNL